jgi:cobalt-zinc-cadmium efflux system outer membrane protein
MKCSLIPILWLGFAGVAHSAEPALEVPGTNVVRLTPSYITQLAEQMRSNHPALRSATALTAAARAGANAVRAWEDPMFKFGGSVADSARGPKLSEDGNLLYGLEQKLPLFGKPSAARAVAVAEAQAQASRASWQFQSLRRDLTRALFRAAASERIVEIGRQDLAWLETMAATTEERFRAGAASQVDVLRIQNERSKRAELVRTDSRRRDAERASVNRLLGSDLHEPLPRFELPDVAGPVNYSTQLVSYAVLHETKLSMMQREIRAAETRVEATRRARRPDVSAGLEARQYSGDGGFREGMAFVSLSLPWFNAGRYRSDLARDKAKLDAAQFDAADYEAAVREEIHHLAVQIDAARREGLLYRDEILPRSEQALTAAHNAWLAGRGMFFDVMEARRMLLEAQSMLARAISEQYQMMSELVLSCGLGDLQMIGVGETPPEPKPNSSIQP